MIHVILDTNEGKALLIGLTKTNCEELVKGRFLTYAAHSHLPFAGINRVIVMGGENEEALRVELLQALCSAERKAPGG